MCTNKVTTNILSPDILPVEDLSSMLRHIESELPSIMHLPISLVDTLNFYWYLNTHVLIVERQFLLLINVAIQNRVQQLLIYEVFNLSVPNNNLSAQYKINHRYIGSHTIKQRQLLSLTNSTKTFSMLMDSSAEQMHHSNPS